MVTERYVASSQFSLHSTYQQMKQGNKGFLLKLKYYCHINSHAHCTHVVEDFRNVIAVLEKIARFVKLLIPDPIDIVYTNWTLKMAKVAVEIS